MFLLLFILLLITWLLGWVEFHVASFGIHVLLILAVIALILHFCAGRQNHFGLSHGLLFPPALPVQRPACDGLPNKSPFVQHKAH